MFRRRDWLHAVLLTFALLVSPTVFVSPVDAADLARPAPTERPVPSLIRTDYLDRLAELMMLRMRFATMLESDVSSRMRAEARSLGAGGPTAGQAVALRHDLTAELYYFVVNLKYLIRAEGAIWPEDRPAATYRNDALSELGAITQELATGDTLVLNIDDILHRLERVNAWTEGLANPVEDWFDPVRRQQLVDNATKPMKGPTRT